MQSGKGREDPAVTVMVSRHVRPGREEEFDSFVSGITDAAMRFPGHLGAEIFRPSASGDTEYRVVFKFNHESNLKRWETSEERRAWYARGKELASDEPTTSVLTGLEPWFTLPGQGTVSPPPRRKMALVTWLAVYPLITAIFWLLGPVLQQLPLPLRTLAASAIMVPLLIYVVMPRMTRLFSDWLRSETPRGENAGEGPEGSKVHVGTRTPERSTGDDGGKDTKRAQRG